MADMGAGETVLTSLFASVTARTAGFNTIDVGGMNASSKLVTIVLMFIGVTINLFLAVAAAVILCGIQELPMEDVLLEVFSAIGTVGMSAGITRELNVVSRIIVILLMYCGRIGSMTFALSFTERKKVAPVQLPAEKIIIG